MKINQRITLEDKNRLVKFTGLIINIAAVINVILNILCLAVGALTLFYALRGFFNSEIDVIHIIILFMLDAAFSENRKGWKKQKSFKYIKNLDKTLTVTEEVPYYDIKADDDAVTVNETFTLKWKDVYAAAYTKEFVILSSKRKTALMIQADDELKLQISEILEKNKTSAYLIVKTPENKKAVKADVKRRLGRVAKRIAVLLLIASIPIAYLMTAKNPVKDLTQEDINQIVMPSEDKNNAGIAGEEQNGVMTVEISTAQELVNMSADYMMNGQKYKDYRFVLTNDIDMSAVENFMPIGIVDADITDPLAEMQYGFCSEFDGQGYTVYNLNINYDGKNINQNNQYHTRLGLFSHITKEGNVKNLNIENAYVTYTEHEEGMYPSAMGILAGSCEGEIVMCAVQGEVNGVTMVGGLAGSVYENGLIDCCHANAKVTGSNELGCMAGNLSFCTVTQSSAEGTVNGLVNTYMDTRVFGENVTPYAVGGFMGRIHYATLEGCHSDVTLQLEAEGKTVGDFAGYCQSSPIIACSYSGAKATVNKPISYYHSGYEDGVSYAYQLTAVN